MIRLLIFILPLCQFLFALNVSQGNAERVAATLFSERNNGSTFQIESVELVSEDSYDLFYIFRLLPKGFILISAEDRVLPILGYSFDNDFIYSPEDPTNINYLLDLFKTEIKDSIVDNIPADSNIQNTWNKYLSANIEPNNFRNMNPLLTARFDQGTTWNTMCPVDQAGPNGHALVGCVAVSMAQVMHYWEYPQYGSGDHGYNSPYGYLYADFGNTFYDYDNMQTNIGTPASQLLLSHAGIAVNMGYGADGSGAWVMGPGSPSTYHAMVNYFNFRSSITGIYPQNFSSSAYRQMLMDDLDLHRPIIYRGCSTDGCHAWNIDGYEGDEFHCNWGWGGYNNGFFPLSTLGGFGYDQGALINIEPQDLSLPNLVINSVEFSDQSGGDNDGVLNPGENINIILELENFIPWSAGSNLEVYLESNDAGIAVNSSSFYIQNIDAGGIFINNSTPLSVSIADDIELGVYDLEVFIIGDDYFEDYTLELDISIDQIDFPYIANQTIESSPAVVDINDDGCKELFFGDYGGIIHGIDCQGNPVSGFPIQIDGAEAAQIWGSPSVDDLDGDGVLEVVFTSKNQHIYIIDVSGNIELEYYTAQYMMGSPALGDIDGDGLKEIVVAGYDIEGRVYALNHDGSNANGFPVQINQKVLRGVALKDLDGNGRDDIVVSTETDKQILLINDAAQVNVLYTASQKFKSAPAIVEIGGEDYIFSGNDNNVLYGIRPNGELVYEFMTGDRIRTSPVFYTFGNNVNIYYGSYDGFLYGKDRYGNDLPGFPLNVSSAIITSPVISDVNNDGVQEIIFGLSSGDIVALDLDNNLLSHFPLSTGVGVTGSPVIADVDSDGDVELFIGANTTLFGIDIKEPSEIDNSWSMHRANLFRNGSFVPSSSYQAGDLNGDSLFNILDVVLLTNLVLSNDQTSSDLLVADLNNDSAIDVLDIVILINMILA